MKNLKFLIWFAVLALGGVVLWSGPTVADSLIPEAHTLPLGTLTIPGPAMIDGGRKKADVKIWAPRGTEPKQRGTAKHGEFVTVISPPTPDEAGKVQIRTAGGVEGWVSASAVAPAVIATKSKGTLRFQGAAYLDGRDLEAGVKMSDIRIWSAAEGGGEVCTREHGTEVFLLEPPSTTEGRAKIAGGKCDGWVNIGFLNEKMPP